MEIDKTENLKDVILNSHNTIVEMSKNRKLDVIVCSPKKYKWYREIFGDSFIEEDKIKYGN